VKQGNLFQDASIPGFTEAEVEYIACCFLNWERHQRWPDPEVEHVMPEQKFKQFNAKFNIFEHVVENRVDTTRLSGTISPDSVRR
jgi:hypothetical protein